MERPDKALEKEFNDAGIFFVEKKTIKEFEGNYIGVEVEIALDTVTKVSCPDFSFEVINRRSVSTVMSDWEIVTAGEQRRIKFTAMMRIPVGIEVFDFITAPADHVYAMTFMDLCFYAGNEAIPEGYQVDTTTVLRENVKLTDLGWILPSRLVDTLIDALGKINDAVLSGMLEEAILYGIRQKRDGNQL